MSSFMVTASQAAAGKNWHIIDAEGQVLGRLATLTARLLQGKHKAIYTPFIDTGDHVVVVNAAKVRLTGRKDEQKIYRAPAATKVACVKSARRSCGAAVQPASSRKPCVACCPRRPWAMRCTAN